MRIHLGDIRRAKRVARALQRELGKLGTDIGHTASLDLAARMYGYASFHELKACIGMRAPSEWDERCPQAVVDARREHQVNALVQSGVDVVRAATVVALIRPTGMQDKDPRPEAASALGNPATTSSADLDALLEEIEEQIGVAGASPEVAAYIDGAILRSYLGGYDCVYLEAYGDNFSMHSRRFGNDNRLHGGNRSQFDEIVRHLARKAWLDPSATGQSKGKFAIRHAGSDIDIKLTLDLSDRFSMVDVEFVTPRRRLPTMDLFSIRHSQDWLRSFEGNGGLHLICARNGSMPLLEALTRKLADDGHRVWGLRSSLEFVAPAQDDGSRPNVIIVNPDYPKEVVDKVVENIGEGNHVVWVTDADSVQEALLSLRGIGYAKDLIREHLRTMLLAVHHDRDSQDACYNWEAQVFPVRSAGGDMDRPISLKPRDILVDETVDGASATLAREASLMGHREWHSRHSQAAGKTVTRH